MRRLATAARRDSDVVWIGAGPRQGKPPRGSSEDSVAVADQGELARLRTVKLPSITQKTANAEFFVVVGAGSRIVGSRFVSGDDALKKAASSLNGASVGMALPGGPKLRVLRRGLVSCAPSSGCSMLLYTPDRVRSLE